MPTTTQTVIIDFQADLTSVQAGIDILEKLGKVDSSLADQFRKTNADIKNQGDALAATAKKGETSAQSFSHLADLMKQFPKSGMNRFLLQIGNDLAKAGLKAEDFFKRVRGGSKEFDLLQKELAETKATVATLTAEFEKLKNKIPDTTEKTKSLRSELKQIKDQMQQAALSGGVLGEEYLRLKKRAGQLDDTIRDVASDIKNAGSDTRGIDNVVGSISALAGGFAAVQGAAALFGDESEDLQKALLKVNGAMSLAIGIQQVSNALQKEGSLVRLADAASTGVQVAVQKIYTAVTGRATAATLLFKIALASTGIGLVVVAFIALSQALKSTTSDLEKATDAIEQQNLSLESSNKLLQRNLNIQIALSEQAGKAESDRLRLTGRSLLAQLANLELSNKKLLELRAAVNSTSEAWFEYTAQLEKNDEAIRELGNQAIVTKINLNKQLADEQKQTSDDAREQSEKAMAAARKQRLSEFEDFKAGVEIKLLAAEKGSRDELDLRKKLARAQLQIDLEGENLTANQRKLLIQQFFADKIELEKKFSKEVLEQSLSDEKLRLAAQLENLNLAEEDKLEVKISFLQISAAQEIEAAEKNAAKIKAINAKLNADITAAKIESIKKQADYEIAFSAATGGGQKRALDAVAANEKLKSDIRINAIRQLGEKEQQVLDRQIKANRDAASVIGSDQKALSLEYEQLLDQKAAATEATEKKITDLTLSEQMKRRDNDIMYIQATVAGLQQIADIVATLQASEQERIQGIIDARRKEVEGLLEAGAITEKEALARNKRLNEEERKAKIKAAQQQKNLAVFQAFLAIPQAYIAGLTAPPPLGGPIYAAILAGLAAVQAAVISARPLPKFASGKKGSYSGPGIVGDAGAELIQRKDGSMEVATRRQLVYLGSQDKVFTAGETKRMLPYVNREAMGMKDGVERFDYNKLAKAVSSKGNGTTVNIDKEFISESVADGLSRVNYFDRYYNSKG